MSEWTAESRDDAPRSQQVVPFAAGATGPGGFDRTPPSDIAAEQCVLGAMMLSKDAIADVIEGIHSGADFYRPAHEMIYDAAVYLFGQGEPVDPVTVADVLARRGELNRVNGAPYLHTLVATVPTAASAPFYARIVKDKAILRRLAEAGDRLAGLAREGAIDVPDLVDEAQAAMYALTSANDRRQYQPVGSSLMELMQEVEHLATNPGVISGLATGYRDLDRMTGGLTPGQLFIVGARPAQGKSMVGLDVARNAAVNLHVPTAVFSLEMGHLELTRRMLSAQATVRQERLKNGSLTESDWQSIARALPLLEAAPLFIDDSPALTIPEIRAKCRRIKSTSGLGLVVVDYLQLLKSPTKVDNRQQEVSAYSRGLKLLAKELEVPVLALSQLNRGSENRADKRPTMSDLRESGAIEQDADIIMLLHREDVYDKDNRPGEADFIVDKHRGGPTGTVTTVFQGHYSRFEDMGRDTS